jgi:hypothetical protein
MKYAIEMGSGAMIYIPSFIKTGSGIQKLIRGWGGAQDGDRISLLLFCQNKESRLRNEAYKITLLYVCVSLIVVRQLLGKHVPAGRNTHATTEELLDAVLSMRFVSYQILNMQ